MADEIATVDDGAAVIEAVDGAVLFCWSIKGQSPTAVDTLDTTYTKQAQYCAHNSC